MKKGNDGTYYILLPGDDEESAMYDSNHLGDLSMGKFWPGNGLKALMKMANTNPTILEQCIVKTDTGKQLTIEDFLKVLKGKHIAEE